MANNALLEKMESQYIQMKGKIKEINADAQMELEKRDFENKLNELRKKGEKISQESMNNLHDSWDKLQKKFNEMVS